MERAPKGVFNGPARRPAAEAISRRARGATDISPGRAAQRELIDAMRSGPAQVAQRRALQAMFGGAAQLESLPEEEPRQMKGAPGVAQRAAAEEDELPVQGKFSPEAGATSPDHELQAKSVGAGRAATPPHAEPTTSRNDTGLPDNLKAGVESLSGLSLDAVKVHYNSSQPAQLNALAYAQGTDIHLAPGQERHLPHEAWHVVQQAQGRVQPTMQMKEGVPVNDDEGLEREADLMGAQALQHR